MGHIGLASVKKCDIMENENHILALRTASDVLFFTTPCQKNRDSGKERLEIIQMLHSN